MTERYTRKDAERAFKLLCETTGHRVATQWDDVGAWQLDYAACYGGYVVHEVLDHGIREPMGSRRRPAREFCSTVNFAVRAFESAARQAREAGYAEGVSLDAYQAIARRA